MRLGIIGVSTEALKQIQQKVSDTETKILEAKSAYEDLTKALAENTLGDKAKEELIAAVKLSIIENEEILEDLQTSLTRVSGELETAQSEVSDLKTAVSKGADATALVDGRVTTLSAAVNSFKEEVIGEFNHLDVVLDEAGITA